MGERVTFGGLKGNPWRVRWVTYRAVSQGEAIMSINIIITNLGCMRVVYCCIIVSVRTTDFGVRTTDFFVRTTDFCQVLAATSRCSAKLSKHILGKLLGTVPRSCWGLSLEAVVAVPMNWLFRFSLLPKSGNRRGMLSMD